MNTFIIGLICGFALLFLFCFISIICLAYKGILIVDNGNWLFRFKTWTPGRIGIIQKKYEGTGKLKGKTFTAYLVVREVCKAQRLSQLELLDVFGLDELTNPYENIKTVEGEYFFYKSCEISWCVNTPISMRIKNLFAKEFKNLSIDCILDKINTHGYDSLNDSERDFLKKNSEK
jgi:hypothetical protein